MNRNVPMYESCSVEYRNYSIEACPWIESVSDNIVPGLYDQINIDNFENKYPKSRIDVLGVDIPRGKFAIKINEMCTNFINVYPAQHNSIKNLCTVLNEKYADRMMTLFKKWLAYDSDKNKTGYTQGMNYLMERIIKHVPSDEEAFWIFTTLMNKLEFLYDDGSPNKNFLDEVTNIVMRKLYPPGGAPEDFEMVYMTPLLSLIWSFFTDLPSEMTDFFITELLVQKNPKDVIIRTSLGISKLIKNKISNVKNTYERIPIALSIADSITPEENPYIIGYQLMAEPDIPVPVATEEPQKLGRKPFRFFK